MSDISLGILEFAKILLKDFRVGYFVLATLQLTAIIESASNSRVTVYNKDKRYEDGDFTLIYKTLLGGTMKDLAVTGPVFDPVYRWLFPYWVKHIGAKSYWDTRYKSCGRLGDEFHNQMTEFKNEVIDRFIQK